jgi:hypothetical protein
MLISASRRTDIPAFFGAWFMDRLKEKHVLVQNPMNPEQVSRIDLDPESVDCVIFWTKNPGVFLPCLDEIDRLGYRYYFQFTLTPYGPDLETMLPDKQKIADTFIELSRRIGKEKLIWRYDPVIITEKYSPAFHAASFESLCAQLSGYTEKCVISFVDSYPFLKENFKTLGIHELSEHEIDEIAPLLASVAGKYGMPLAACAEKRDLSCYGILPNRCVDPELIERLFGIPVKYKKDPSQRVQCGCSASRDIGAYGTCRHGCVYCYARRGRLH